MSSLSHDTSRQITPSPIVQTGADRILRDAADLIRGKRIGLLTNHTGVLSDGRHIADAIHESGIARLVALYGPEHGIFGDTADGEAVKDAGHPRYDIPIYSLYGDSNKPTAEMLAGVEVLVCDIQEVGARFYTFISTIALAVEAAAELKIPCVVLDRPNPIRGISFDGPVREDALRSFVGWMPIPVTHGMTIGELARLWNEEGQFAGGVRARLDVVPMLGWERTMWYDDTGLPWNAPSPNMRSLTTATVYPGLCFVEGTSLSEGRGTAAPFETIGAPWADPERVLKHLDAFRPAGVAFREIEFTPRTIPGTAANPKFEQMRCRGIQIAVVDRNVVQPVRLGIQVIAAFKRAHPAEMKFQDQRFDFLTGSMRIRRMVEDQADPAAIAETWESDLAAFGRVRAAHLQY